MKRKIVLAGGGSAYFEGVISEFCLTPELGGCRVTLYDVDRKRMEVIRNAGRRIAEKTGAELTLTATTELARALDGADFVISSIGVHGPGARWHKTDTDVCARFGIIHTTGDSVGPAGLSQGLRLIPIYLDLAREMERRCPGAPLLNHSNPMSAICRAVRKYTKVRAIGYCHNVAGDVRYFAKVLGVPHEELDAVAVGPNHMVWLLGLTHRGRDVYPELRRRILAGKPAERHIFAREVLGLLGYFPIGGDRHMVEFYPHARVPCKPEELEYGMRWRSTTIEEGRLAREINKAPSELELRAAGKLPPLILEELSPESMGRQVRAMALGQEMVHYVNAPNGAAVENLPEWAVLEMKCLIDSRGASPVRVGPLPPQLARWSLATIYAHELTVDAAAEGSREKALQALACDPMIVNFHEVEPLFDALVEAQADRLARFRKRRG
jgi:alpha-galactosidase